MTILIVLASVAVLILALVAVISTRPNIFQVTRSLTIHAPAEAVFPLVNDLHEHVRWSPFMQTDPAMACTYEGSTEGNGSSLHWNGNRQAGEGRMTIVDSQPGTHVGFHLEFLRPFRATNSAEITFEPLNGGDTRVTWSMSGHQSFMCKAFGLFIDCDKMCGGEFEKGLAQLKALSENDAVAAVPSAH